MHVGQNPPSVSQWGFAVVGIVLFELYNPVMTPTTVLLTILLHLVELCCYFRGPSNLRDVALNYIALVTMSFVLSVMQSPILVVSLVVHAMERELFIAW